MATGRKRPRRYADVTTVRSGDRITVEWHTPDCRWTVSGLVSQVKVSPNRALRSIFFGTTRVYTYQVHAGIRPMYPNVDARVFLDEAAPAESEAFPMMEWPELFDGENNGTDTT